MRHVLAVFVAVLAIGWASVYTVTSASNQARYKRTGAAGSSLRIGTARDASTDCMAAATDFATGAGTTAGLTCNHTGDMIVDGFNQINVGLAFTRSAGTAVKMQCDYSNDSGTTWRSVPYNDGGTVTPRTWTWTTSATGKLAANFDIDYELMRCRASVTTGNSGDKISFAVQLAK